MYNFSTKRSEFENDYVENKKEIMNENEILEKYGSMKLQFVESYKHAFTYVSIDKKYKIFGQSEYSGEFKQEMTVRELWDELQTFEFTTLSIFQK
jgi:hypothetical protein